MGKKYIIELDDNKLAYTVIIIDGVPYTELDLEQVRKEAFEKIRQYEQRQEEQKEEKPILVEDVMRQYLNIFCDSHRCLDDKCPLHTPEFTCGRGKHFLSLPHNRVSDEEVRRAYAKVMKENNND